MSNQTQIGKRNSATTNKNVSNSTANDVKAPTLTEGRKAELLQSARRSRIQWVLDGRDHHPILPLVESSSSKKDKGPVATPQITNASELVAKAEEEAERQRQSIQQIITQIPAAQCIQEVLEFFNQLINDGESVDLESILLTIEEEDNVDLLVEHFKQLSNSTTTTTTTTPSSSSSSSSSSSTLLVPTSATTTSSSGVSQYDLFIKKLLHPQAALVVKAMQQFITKFMTTIRRNTKQQANSNNSSSTTISTSSANGVRSPTDGNAPQSIASVSLQAIEEEMKKQSNSIWTFLEHIYEIMKECPLFCEENPAQFDDSKLSCEKFVFSKLHSFLFTANDYNDRILNQSTSQRIEALSFVTIEHLDIKSLHGYLRDYQQQQKRQQQSNAATVSSSNTEDPIEQLLAKPIAYLQHFQDVKCPSDALLILRYCSQAIAQILKECRSDGKLPGADELLPVMILVIKYANPPNIHSWIKYLQRYTRPNKLVSEAGYLITNFVSAVYFLDNVDAKALTISPEEFDHSMKISKLRAKEKIQKQIQQHDGRNNDHSSLSNSLRGNEEASLETLIVEYQQQIKKQAQKEYISIKATMSLLQYGKP